MSDTKITNTVNKSIDNALKNAENDKDAARDLLVAKYDEYNNTVKKAEQLNDELDVLVGELYRRDLTSIVDVANIVGVTRQTIHKKLTAMFNVKSLKEVKPPKYIQKKSQSKSNDNDTINENTNVA